MDLKKWTDFQDIKNKLDKKWKSGEMLRNVIEENDLFLLKIKISAPSINEMSSDFEKVIKWVDHLRSKSKDKLGFGYNLEEKETNFRLFGKNLIPNYAIIDTLEDALRLLHKKTETKLLQNVYQDFLKEWELHPKFSEIKDWFLKYPFKALEQIGENSSKIIIVLKWFEENPNHFVYIRQLDIEGIDTKFIEKNQTVLSELLEIILPETDYDINQKKFEDKFKLRKKPAMIRFRILDNNYSSQVFRDITIPVEEFHLWKNNIEKVFFTENEINFLSFPNVEKSIVIFGKGYGVHLFGEVEWLKEKQVFYWGDIDTHGFNILSIARGFIPELKSFLMTEQILIEHQNLWVKEEAPFVAEVKNLTIEERDLLDKLQNNFYGENIRLEQERICYRHLEEWIKEIY